MHTQHTYTYNNAHTHTLRTLFTHSHMQHTHTHVQGLVCSIALANGRHANPVASNFYVRSFLQRHPELAEIKSSVVGHHRAKQATAEVRDAVFAKLQVFPLPVSCTSRITLTTPTRTGPD